MTLEQFVKPIDGHATFTIYKDGQPFLNEGSFDYTVLPDEAWVETKAHWRRREPTCMSQTEWWSEVKDLEVTCWNVAGFGYGDALTIVFLKSAEKEEIPEAKQDKLRFGGDLR